MSSADRGVPRSRIAAWALWDCGSTGMNAIVATFVFSVYLTGTVGAGLPGDTSPAASTSIRPSKLPRCVSPAVWLHQPLTDAPLTRYPDDQTRNTVFWNPPWTFCIC